MLVILKLIIDFVLHNIHAILHLGHAEEQLLLTIRVPILDQRLAVGVLELVPGRFHHLV